MASRPRFQVFARHASFLNEGANGRPPLPEFHRIIDLGVHFRIARIGQNRSASKRPRAKFHASLKQPRIFPCESSSARLKRSESALRTYKLRHELRPASTAAELLSQGKILGGFRDAWNLARGRLEAIDSGRSARSEMNAKVNNAVKFREWWRPFAPSFKKEAAGEYLESATDSPFMILNGAGGARKNAG